MTSPRSPFLFLGALAALLAVALGAFGAHVLRARMDPRSVELFQTAARYQMYHALALVLTGLLPTSGSRSTQAFAGYSFLAGIVVFCGTLYAMSLGGPRLLGAVTPLGGLLFMLGWGALAATAW